MKKSGHCDGDFCKYLVAVMLLVVYLLTVSPVVYPGNGVHAENTVKNVLVLNSYNRGVTWSDNETDGILEALQTSKEPVNIFVEYLDWRNFPTDENLNNMLNSLNYKYKSQQKKIDLIVTTDDTAIDFVLKYRKDLFGDIPIVFCGVYEDKAGFLMWNNRNITGCVESIDPEETLKVAFSIYPDAKNVYVVHDNTESGFASLRDVLGAVRRMKMKDVTVRSFGSLHRHDFNDYSPADLKESILILTSAERDVHGVTATYEDFASLFCSSINFPVFNTYEMSMGYGPVGGALLSGRLHGKKAGQIAVRILNGEPASGIPLQNEKYTVTEYDYNALKRFGIPLDKLPKGSIILHNPFSFYETYKTLVWSVSAAFAGLVLFVAFMAINTVRRKRAEEALALSNVELVNKYHELEMNRETIRNNEQKYKLLFDISNDGFWDIDPGSRERHFSDKWYEIFSSIPCENIEHMDNWFSIIHPDDLMTVRRLYRDMMDGRSKEFFAEYRIMTKEDGYRWIAAKAGIIKDSSGTVIKIVGSHSDIHQKKLHEEQITRLAYFDSLTGLANRVRLANCFGEMQKNGIRKAALIFMDIDNFKVVNDTLSHAAGDCLIVEIAKRLRALFDERHTVARLGGDEFAILMVDTDRRDEIAACLDRLMSIIREDIRALDINLAISASFGIAMYPDDGEDFDELLKNADIAMYSAKGKGKRSYMFFDAQMNLKLKDCLLMENHLRNALANQEFFLHYQPEIRLGTDKVFGFEALLRWQSPIYGLVPPGRFIHLLEETGLIIPVGKWVMEEACRFIRKMHMCGHPEMVISVNVSVIQLLQVDFVETVLQIVETAGMEPSRLNIEITESILMEAIESNIDKIKRLRSYGINVALDDFGKGYSSLTYLKQLPINILKIDKEFIHEITDKNESRSITGAVITLAHELRMEVVAEGVETGEQYRFLENSRCDIIQGYLICPPIAEDEIPGFLESLGKRDRFLQTG